MVCEEVAGAALQRHSRRCKGAAPIFYWPDVCMCVGCVVWVRCVLTWLLIRIRR